MTDSKKIKRISSLRDPDSSIVLIEFKGEVHHLTHDDVEHYLERFFEMREKLSNEKRLRKEFEALDEAYKQYQTILNLVINNKKDRKNYM